MSLAIEETGLRRLELHEIKEIRDSRLRGLTFAAYCWRITHNSDRKLRMELARELHAYQMFSLNQIANIVRLNVGTIARVLKKNAVGGALNPEALTAIAHLRKRFLDSNSLYLPMVKQVVSEGTNLSTLCRLVGVNNGHYYRILKEQS